MECKITDNLHSVSLGKTFDEQCPFYMLMGMTYEEFWDKEPAMAMYYRKRYKLKQRERNRDLWLQGLYIYEALCDVAPVLQAFAKRGTKVRPYSQEPYCLSEKEQQEREQEKEKEKMLKLKKIFTAFATSFNKKKGAPKNE